MRIISSTGFGFSGSTAITDLISEYDIVDTPKVRGYELKFFHEANGILGLYNNLVKNKIPHANYSSINSFEKLCNEWANSGTTMNYELFFSNKFLQFTDKYLKELGGNDYFIDYDFSSLTSFQWFIYKVLDKLDYYKYYLFRERKYGELTRTPLTIFAKQKRSYLYSVDEENFIKITKEYMRNLFENITHKQFFNIHELIPVQMIDECTKYFDDICIIKTDRDPRDIYLTAKRKWLTPGYPCKDVYTFCKYYKWLHTINKKYEKSSVLPIQFEDLVYHYEDTVKGIEHFTGLDASHHVNLKTHFIPEKSMLNCNLKEQYPDEADNIKVIEKELEDYLYKF